MIKIRSWNSNNEALVDEAGSCSLSCNQGLIAKWTYFIMFFLINPVSEEQMPAHSPIWAWVLLSAQGWSTFPWLCGHEIFNETFQNRKQGHHRWICRSFCHFPLPWSEMLEIKSNKFCKKSKCNRSMLRYFNISVS